MRNSFIFRRAITQTKEKCRKSLQTKPKVVYRRNKNLKDILVRSKFEKVKEILTHRKSTPCKKLLCSWCPYMKVTDTFKSNSDHKEYKILHELNCNSPCVIYLVTCKKCNKQYVGKSERQLNTRLNNHRSHLKN